MRPAEGGRFCARCSETVVDLSRARRADAERRVLGGAARCAQLAVDEHGRAVFAAEPPSRVAKLALRLAVVGAVASGCAAGEGAAGDGIEDAARAPEDGSGDDGSAPGARGAGHGVDDGVSGEGRPGATVEPLSIGSGSLLTGRRGDIPAVPRPAPPPLPITTPVDARTTRNAPPPTIAPPTPGIAPRVHHLRGRVAYRP